MHNSFIKDEYHRDKQQEMWKGFETDLKRLKNSFDEGTWQANPTPLCGWCPVNKCEFHKER
jgi:hypothetical protein